MFALVDCEEQLSGAYHILQPIVGQFDKADPHQKLKEPAAPSTTACSSSFHRNISLLPSVSAFGTCPIKYADISAVILLSLQHT